MKEYRKNYSNNVSKKTKENHELKNIEVGMVTNFIKNKIESLSDADVYTDDDYDSEEDKIIGFR